MRIAVISDIHGNCVALDAVLDELQEQAVDQLVCLGDAVQAGRSRCRSSAGCAWCSAPS
ncbi:MAG: metallophosphatase family protein [Chloroflexota bacterium]|nr:metallophosphatase family protein [Chloroflexota bacterium]